MASRAGIRQPARGCPRMSVGLGEWREVESSPSTGKCSAPALYWFGNICDDPFSATRFPLLWDTEAPRYAFFRHGGIYRSDVAIHQPWGGNRQPPARRSRAQGKERAGRIALFSSSTMSSDRLFLDRVARQHCPSPLHRHEQINTHSSDQRAKGDISTLPARGTFLLCRDSRPRWIDIPWRLR